MVIQLMKWRKVWQEMPHFQLIERKRQLVLRQRDDKVRDTHMELDGQVVDVNEKFVVPSTGNSTESPAAFGIAEEDINCRCTLIPVIGD